MDCESRFLSLNFTPATSAHALGAEWYRISFKTVAITRNRQLQDPLVSSRILRKVRRRELGVRYLGCLVEKVAHQFGRVGLQISDKGEFRPNFRSSESDVSASAYQHSVAPLLSQRYHSAWP